MAMICKVCVDGLPALFTLTSVQYSSYRDARGSLVAIWHTYWEMALNYPLVCYTEAELNNLIPTIRGWFIHNEWYHFNPISHLQCDCSESKHDLQMGQHPIIKIIYIDDLLIPRALQIISDLNEKYPEHLDEQVSDDEDNAVRCAQRVAKLIFQCPACHMLFDCSL